MWQAAGCREGGLVMAAACLELIHVSGGVIARCGWLSRLGRHQCPQAGGKWEGRRSRARKPLASGRCSAQWQAQAAEWPRVSIRAAQRCEGACWLASAHGFILQCASGLSERRFASGIFRIRCHAGRACDRWKSRWHHACLTVRVASACKPIQCRSGSLSSTHRTQIKRPLSRACTRALFSVQGAFSPGGKPLFLFVSHRQPALPPMEGCHGHSSIVSGCLQHRIARCGVW